MYSMPSYSSCPFGRTHQYSDHHPSPSLPAPSPLSPPRWTCSSKPHSLHATFAIYRQQYHQVPPVHPLGDAVYRHFLFERYNGLSRLVRRGLGPDSLFQLYNLLFAGLIRGLGGERRCTEGQPAAWTQQRRRTLSGKSLSSGPAKSVLVLSVRVQDD
jgi:hypothetical protein